MEDRKTKAKRLVAMRRGERDRKKIGVRRLVAMRRIGKDTSKMKFSSRYPKLQLRIGNELLTKLEKEINESGMTTSEILREALRSYFERNS